MAEPDAHLPPGLPPGLRRVALGGLDDGPVLTWVPPDAGTLWVALSAGQAAYFAHDDATRTRIAIEARRLRWAAHAGIPVPAVLEASADVLITQRAPEDPQDGAAFAATAIAAADAIAGAPAPPADVLAGGGGARRRVRRTLPRRIARMLIGRLDPRAFAAARNAAAALPADTLAHGDYQPANLLYDAAADQVRLIDFELLGYAPAGTDLLTLWPQVVDDEARALVLDAARARVPDPVAFGTLRLWLALRYLADLLTGEPMPEWRHDRIARARLRVAEAREGLAHA